MIDLKNKNIIVTGATGGIGHSIIEKLNNTGANILATGTRKEKLDESIRPQAHSDIIYDKINTYGLEPDIVIEAKLKEQAVFNHWSLSRPMQ